MNPNEKLDIGLLSYYHKTSISIFLSLVLFILIPVVGDSQDNALKTDRYKDQASSVIEDKLENLNKENDIEKPNKDQVLEIPPKENPFLINEKCGIMYVEEMMKSRYAMPSIEQFEQWMEKEKIKLRKSPKKRAVTTIPVVIHIIYDGVSMGGNITDAQALSQIDVLNEDFRRMNADAANTPADFLGVAADLELEFSLATVDPDGNASNGINRYDGGQASYSILDLEDYIKPATAWNPEYYFNIWCAPLQGGLLGYAQFPSTSGLDGMPDDGGPDYTDGIVVRDIAFGNTGTAGAPFHLGRVGTHEAGHFFGLRHIWGDGNCSVDDFCADTPTQGGNNGNIGAPCTYPGPNSCVDAGTDFPDQFMNYMDYSDDECSNMYTMDQKARVDVVLANSPRRAFVNSQVHNGVQPPFWEPDLPDPPVNDLCDNAIPIDCDDSLVGTTLGSTNIGNPSPCATGLVGGGVWYKFTGNGMQVTLSTCGQADYDSQINVYSGSCGSLVCVGGNDDGFGCGTSSRVTVATVDMQEYYVFVNGFAGDRGDFTLSMTCDVGSPPDNDVCTGAITLNCGDSVYGNTTNATITDAPGDCGTTVTAPGIWYTIEGTGDFMIVSTCNTASYDTKISVYSGSCGSLLCVDGNDDNFGAGCGGFTSELVLQSVVGETYLIYVHGFGSATGEFLLSVNCVPPPVNDLCDGAIQVSCGDVVIGNTNFAAAIGVPTTDCSDDPFSDDMGPGVWYSFIGTGEWIQLSTCDAANFDTKIDVFTGTCGSLSCVAGNDDGEACSGFTSAFGFQSIIGVEYLIYVSGFTIGEASSTGDFELSVCPGCNITNASLDPFWTPDGGLFCQLDGNYFASFRIDGIDLNSFNRNEDGSIDDSLWDIIVDGESYPIIGAGFDNISVPGINYFYLESIIAGNGDLDVDVKVTIRDDCMFTSSDLFNEPMCPCNVDAGDDQVHCIAMSSIDLSATSTGTGMWSIVEGGSGTFGDPFNPTTTYMPDNSDFGNVVILRWTRDDTDGCSGSFDDIEIDFASCIPTVSTWGIIVLSLLLITISLVAIRSRKILMS